MRFGWSPDIISACLPFTSDVISSRGRAYESIAVGYFPQKAMALDDDHPVGKRRIDDSWLEIVVPFADQETLRESMMRADKKNIRYGKLFELLDALAGDVAYRHCGGHNGDLTIVTASVDGVTNFSHIGVLANITLQGYLTYVGSSSMEITIDIIDTTTEEKLLETKFIMVARSGDVAKKVPGLLIANEKAQAMFDQGKEQAVSRRIRAQQSLSVSPPRPEEVHLIHNLYLQSIQQRQAQDSLSGTASESDSIVQQQRYFSMILSQSQSLRIAAGINSSIDTTTTSTAAATTIAGTTAATAAVSSTTADFSQELLNHYNELVKKSRTKWMSNTVFKSAQLMHIQDRNVHGKIFGGYIMRKAFETAYVSTVCFFGEENPHFLFVDDIQFVRPVSVGSVAEFVSTVVYSDAGHIVVQVVVMEVDHITEKRNKTNVLTYIFRSSIIDKDTSSIESGDEGALPLPKVNTCRMTKIAIV